MQYVLAPIAASAGDSSDAVGGGGVGGGGGGGRGATVRSGDSDASRWKKGITWPELEKLTLALRAAAVAGRWVSGCYESNYRCTLVLKTPQNVARAFTTTLRQPFTGWD